MRLAFIKCHGSGNDFPLIDARAIALGDPDWARVAQALADRDGPVGGDGLLLLVAGDDSHAFGMRMFNSDGSEAETCLNGLRCVARAGFEALGVDAARVRLKTSSADVARETELAPGRGDGPHDGGPCLDRAGRYRPEGPAVRAAQRSDVHRGGDAQPASRDLRRCGRRGRTGRTRRILRVCSAAVPDRANVSFVEQRGPDLFVRTFERGVGLTDSCGSAMAASVLAAGLTGRVPTGSEVRVFNKGGLVRGRAGADRVVTISGNATFLYDASIEIDLATGRAENPIVHARREDEASAWDAAVAALG
jgi:diaminopimelate epimerase